MTGGGGGWGGGVESLFHNKYWGGFEFSKVV